MLAIGCQTAEPNWLIFFFQIRFFFEVIQEFNGQRQARQLVSNKYKYIKRCFVAQHKTVFFIV